MADLLFQPPTQPTTPETPDQGNSSWNDDAAASLGSDPDAGTPSVPRSTASARRKVRELLPMTQAAVTTAGGMAHTLLTADGTPERAVGLYLPDEDDVDAISEPLAGLASRRMPEGAENPDVSDIVRLVLGFVGYITKQLQKRAAVLEATMPLEDDAGDDEGADAA